MDEQEARETLRELKSYTDEKSKLMGVATDQGGSNSNGPWKRKIWPWGAITHYTASNMSVSKRRPLGRLPVLHNRFARGGKQRVGVHFIIWDRLEPRFEELRDRYAMLRANMPGEVAFFGDDLAFWHAGWCNDKCYGIEIRNAGRLTSKDGVYFWGKNRYRGRPPIKVGRSWWEPYTRQQMMATLWVHRLMASTNRIFPSWFLGHKHVTNTRIDPGLHFPLHEMREYALDEDKNTLDIATLPFIQEFSDDGEIDDRDDPFVSEESLHKGLYRHDWDGVPEEHDGLVVWDMDDGEAEAEEDEVKQKLTSLGYYVGTPQAYADTIKIFRTRWKKRRGKRYVQEIPINGKMDEVALKKLDLMVKQADLM